MTIRKKVLEDFLQRVWTEQDLAAIDELFVPTGRARGLGANTLVGPEGFKVFHQALSTLLKDIHNVIDHYIEEGDWVSALLTVNAKSQASGQPVSFTGSLYGVINNGQIQQAYNHFDFMGLYAQLGLLPSDCFEQGLSGCQVV